MNPNRCPVCGDGFANSGACAGCGYRPERISGFDCYAPDLAREGGGYDAKHYATLAELEARNFWFRARNELILHALRKYCPDMQSFLEIGCGTGFVLSAVREDYPSAETMGSEIFVEGLEHAAQRLPSTHLVQMDARSLPYDRVFSAIGAFDVIEHIDQDTEVLAEIHRALADRGLVVLTVPQHPWLWSAQDEHAHHVRRYARKELVGKVRSAGFEILMVTSFVSMLLPALMLSRLKGKAAADDANPFREFEIPGWLNGILYRCMMLDVSLIKAGLRLPAGGSLLLVARKES